MKKTLKELIEMARSGIKFEARMAQTNEWLPENNFYTDHALYFKTVSIISMWEVRMKREPRVIWLYEQDVVFGNGETILSDEWYYEAEHVRPNAKPIKFIEVMDEP